MIQRRSAGNAGVRAVVRPPRIESRDLHLLPGVLEFLKDFIKRDAPTKCAHLKDVGTVSKLRKRRGRIGPWQWQHGSERVNEDAAA